MLGHTVSAPVDYSGTLERWDSYEDFNKFSTVTTIDGNQTVALFITVVTISEYNRRVVKTVDSQFGYTRFYSRFI